MTAVVAINMPWATVFAAIGAAGAAGVILALFLVGGMRTRGAILAENLGTMTRAREIDQATARETELRLVAQIATLTERVEMLTSTAVKEFVAAAISALTVAVTTSLGTLITKIDTTISHLDAVGLAVAKTAAAIARVEADRATVAANLVEADHKIDGVASDLAAVREQADHT